MARDRDKYNAVNAESRRAKRAWLKAYKSERGCQKCGETHPATLQFHHRNPADKKFEIGRMTNGTWGMESLRAEIAKCDLLCCNCHSKEHYRE